MAIDKPKLTGAIRYREHKRMFRKSLLVLQVQLLGPIYGDSWGEAAAANYADIPRALKAAMEILEVRRK